jgi:hypothetical protein
MCLEESCPEQRTIAKEILDAWDEMIRPDRMMICSD